MAKVGAVEKAKRQRRTVARFKDKRAGLKAAVAGNSKLSPEERFAARLKLAALPRDGSPTRIRNRCLISGRPRGYYRKFQLSRIALRELGSKGLIPGLVKSSW